MAALARKERRLSVWERSDVPYCSCPALSYKHTHCPCERCRGKAVSRSTEFRHWKANAVSSSTQTLQSSTEPPDSDRMSASSHSSSHEFAIEDDPHTVDGDASQSSSEFELSQLQNSQLQPTRPHSATTTTTDVMWGVVEALQLMDDLDASQQDFLRILRFGEELHNRGHGKDQSESHWPHTWQEAQRILHEAGLQDPKTYYICLDESHRCTWDVMEDASDVYRFCPKEGAIKSYSLSVCDKVRRWCSSEQFCAEITAHWEERDHWLDHDGGWMTRKEIWDGSR